MTTEKITPRAGLRLRKIGSKYMIVETSDSCVNLTNVFSMNSTAAWMWESLCAEPCTANELADRLCAEYDVDRERALSDVCRQLGEWKEQGLLS